VAQTHACVLLAQLAVRRLDRITIRILAAGLTAAHLIREDVGGTGTGTDGGATAAGRRAGRAAGRFAGVLCRAERVVVVARAGMAAETEMATVHYWLSGGGNECCVPDAWMGVLAGAGMYVRCWRWSKSATHGLGEVTDWIASTSLVGGRVTLDDVPSWLHTFDLELKCRGQFIVALLGFIQWLCSPSLASTLNGNCGTKDNRLRISITLCSCNIYQTAHDISYNQILDSNLRVRIMAVVS
jgi:hypothetical protein